MQHIFKFKFLRVVDQIIISNSFVFLSIQPIFLLKPNQQQSNNYMFQNNPFITAMKRNSEIIQGQKQIQPTSYKNSNITLLAIDQKEMQGPLKMIQYTTGKCYHLIELYKTSLNITIDDFDKKTMYITRITNEALTQPFQISNVYQQIYKQYVHENKVAKRMLRCDYDRISILFDYPKATIKQLTFPCKKISTDDTHNRMEMIERLIEQKIEHLQRLSEKYTSRIEEAASNQMKNIAQIIEKKLAQITAHIDTESEQKMDEFYKFYQESQRDHVAALRTELQQSVNTVIKDNGKIIKEFHVVKSKLQASILSLNSSIEVIDEKINDMRDEMDEDKEAAQNEITKVYEAIQQSSATIWEKITQINEKLGKVLHEANLPEHSVSEQMFKETDSIKLEIFPEVWATKHIEKEGEDFPSQNCEHS